MENALPFATEHRPVLNSGQANSSRSTRIACQRLYVSARSFLVITRTFFACDPFGFGKLQLFSRFSRNEKTAAEESKPVENFRLSANRLTCFRLRNRNSDIHPRKPKLNQTTSKSGVPWSALAFPTVVEAVFRNETVCLAAQSYLIIRSGNQPATSDESS